MPHALGIVTYKSNRDLGPGRSPPEQEYTA
jgi:hypothetical protein